MKALILAIATLLALAACSAGTTTTAPAATAQVQPDPGSIWFGSIVDSSTMTMPSHTDTFSASTPFGWPAIFSGPPNATTLTLTVASVAAGGAETTVDTGDINWSNRQANELSRSPDITVGAFGAGTYTIRYVVTGSVLAAGTVTITP